MNHYSIECKFWLNTVITHINYYLSFVNCVCVGVYVSVYI